MTNIEKIDQLNGIVNNYSENFKNKIYQEIVDQETHIYWKLYHQGMSFKSNNEAVEYQRKIENEWHRNII